MTNLNIFEIWVKPTYDNNGEIDTLNYFYKPDKKNNQLPILLHHLLNVCCNNVILPQGDESVFFSDGYYPIRLNVHSAQSILTGQASNSSEVCIFGQDKLENKNVYDIIYPVIHITLPDLFIHSFYGTEALPKPVPRSYMIMDNSIWNYLVPITGSYHIRDMSVHYECREKLGFEEWLHFFELSKRSNDRESNYQHQSVDVCLAKALKSICNNYKKQLYRLKVAREYADLNARLTQQSFLSGAHASGVAPFIFHSESCTKDLILREFRGGKNGELPSVNEKYVPNSLMENIVKDRKWRILLLDDKALDPMDYIYLYGENETNKNDNDTKNKEGKTGGWNCKLTIIRDILEYQLHLEKGVNYCPCDTKEKSSSIPDETMILIEYAQNLDDAEKALKTKKYDFILLDYLLNQENGTHYGYELLEKIWNDQQQNKDKEENCQFKYKIAPHRSQRLYCMFISAYSYAVHDRLLAEGLTQSEDYWYISLGACPTNTPQLFLYNLLKLMEKRLEDSGILKLSSKEIYKLINSIYSQKEQNSRGDSVRKRANDRYQDVLSLQYHYRSILKDVEIPLGDKNSVFDTNGSVLMTNFIQTKVNMGGLLEHLTQLVHLTAFGTVRQWHEMWEEYIYFKALFEKQVAQDGETVDYETLFSNIENHILKLRSQQ